MDDLIGKEILNYQIISFIGKGGMGSVYLGVHKYINEQKVAIKVINGNMLNDFTRKMLAGEAKSLASLNHNNIVHFHNYHVDEDGLIYLIMEYAGGIGLDQYLQKISGPIVEDRVCAIFDQILDAFGYAHQHKIIHCDIKPSNIMVTTDGTPKVLDFGIAKIIKGDGSAKDGYVMGTPSYMSPEQVKGESLTAASDIYSIGVVLSQMLTGRAPYDTTTLSENEIYSRVVEKPLPRMKTYYAYVSDEMQAIVDKATSKNPYDRYQSCAEFKAAIHQMLDNKKGEQKPDEKSKDIKKSLSSLSENKKKYLIGGACGLVAILALVIVLVTAGGSNKSNAIKSKYSHVVTTIDSLTNIGNAMHVDQLVMAKSLVDTLTLYENEYNKYLSEITSLRVESESRLSKKIDSTVESLMAEADSKMEYAVDEMDYKDAIKTYEKILLLKDDPSVKKKISIANEKYNETIKSYQIY